MLKHPTHITLSHTSSLLDQVNIIFLNGQFIKVQGNLYFISVAIARYMPSTTIRINTNGINKPPAAI
jgi:hypothetical protein